MTQSSAETRNGCRKRESEKRRLWPDWTGETVCIFAGGPSLTAEQIEYTNRFIGLKTIAVNEAGLARFAPLSVPHCDILYAADYKWWHFYKPESKGRMRVSADDTLLPGITKVDMVGCDALMPREPGSLVPGDHSGFQALGLALQLGASRILLLGFDCGGPKRNAHENRDPCFLTSDGAFLRGHKYYHRARREWPDVEIINCSPLTTIDAFPVMDITEALT